MVTFYRRLPKLDYVRAESVEEVLKLLEKGDGKVKIYAGGTDVIPRLKTRAIPAPALLVDLKGIPDLDYVTLDGEGRLRIGALASIFSVANAPLVKQNFPMLAQAVGSIASIQVQNRGTVVGNICNAVPSADSAPALLCLGARAVCVGPRGERTIGLESFFKGPNQTVLDSDEIVKELRVPPVPEGGKGTYTKLSPRRRMDLAVVGVAALVQEEKGKIQDIRIGLGAVAPTPRRALKTEAVLRGAKVSEGKIVEAAKTASEESEPIDDHRASAEYRRMMVEVLVNRIIRQSLSM
jgi:CO/xanthine dehydrogenase FAD-binding subunit